MKRAPIADIFLLFVATRLLLIAATFLGFILFPVPPHVYPVQPVDMVGLLDSWDRWDAVHYTLIAQFGYQNIYNTAFFPLFPLLIKGGALLLGNHGYIAMGMIISNLALLGSLFVLYQIAADMLGEHVGRRTILYLCIFPTAFFFFAPYNESLFLLLTASAFLALRRQKWWLAGVLGFFAALTRSAGLLLVFPYLYELWIARKELPDEERNTLSRIWQTLPKLLPIALIPLGIAVYAFYCWRVFNAPLAFSTVQSHWDRQLTPPGTGIVFALGQLFFVQPFGSFFEVHILIDLAATIGFIVLAILGWRKLRSSYTLWIGLLLLYTLISPAIHQADSLVSTQRFVLEMFPGFITLAALSIKRPRLHSALLIAFPFFQAILAVLFVLNRWMV